MAKKKEVVKPKSTLEMTWEELFENREKHDNFNMELYGKPTRTFEIGEHVILGNLKDVFIAHDYGDGIYAVEIPFKPVNRQDDYNPTGQRRVMKWIDIGKVVKSGDSTFVNTMYRRPSFSQSDFSAIIHMNSHNGFVMDDRFQRGYVWNDDDREALLDTIFNQGNIGSFLFNRDFGYDFKDSDEVNQFHTITGEKVLIPKKDNFCISVIDGQQRITTLLNFYFDRFKYKGYYFSEMSFKDRMTFEHFPVSYALVDESDGWNLKDWVWLFLQANKGVSQSREHLVKMEEYYKGL
jgi:hypothetical protein